MLRRSWEVYRDEGFASLTRKGLRLAYLEFLLPAYWTFRGRRTIRIGSLDATFLTETREEAATVDYVARNERPVIADLLAELGPGDVFFDVGANLGVHTCFAAQRIASGRVVAFEPYPPNVTRLRANVELNACQVDLVTTPLWSARETIRFGQPEEERPGHQSAGIVPGDSKRTLERTAVPGDQLVGKQSIPQPTVVKIDVEGAEAHVIDGMRETLSDDDCRVVYCEVHLPTSADRPAVTDFSRKENSVRESIEELGFTTEIIHERPRDYHVKGWKGSPQE